MNAEVVRESISFKIAATPKKRNNTIAVQATGSIIVSKAYTGAGDVKNPIGTMHWKSNDPIRVELDKENDRIILQKLEAGEQA